MVFFVWFYANNFGVGGNSKQHLNRKTFSLRSRMEKMWCSPCTGCPPYLHTHTNSWEATSSPGPCSPALSAATPMWAAPKSVRRFSWDSPALETNTHFLHRRACSSGLVGNFFFLFQVKQPAHLRKPLRDGKNVCLMERALWACSLGLNSLTVWS